MSGPPAPDVCKEEEATWPSGAAGEHSPGELRAVLEDVLDRKLGEALKDLGRLQEVLGELRELRDAGPPEPEPPSCASPRAGNWHVSLKGGGAFSPRAGHPDPPCVEAAEGNGQEPEGRLSSNEGSIPPRRESLGEEAGEQYESLYDLTRAFRTLCPRQRASIAVDELLEMSAGHQCLHPSDESLSPQRERLRMAVRALNRELGTAGAARAPKLSEEISLDGFIAIMHRPMDLHKQMSSHEWEAIAEVRGILVQEDAHRKVAKATNINALEISRSRAALVPSRTERFLIYLDPFIGFVILLNAIVICLSTDFARESDVWMVCEVTFTVVFISEIFVKIGLYGVHDFLFGQERYWNVFDTVVVLLVTVDLVLTLLGTLVTLRNFTMVRLLRFARLTKLVRVLKLKLFKELALMVNGVLAGFRVLLWAIVFLGFVLFCLGVFLAQAVGHEDPERFSDTCVDVDVADLKTACVTSSQHLARHRKELFGNVFRSMFTVFRCFTDGCSSVDGTPLAPYFYDTFGSTAIVCYMLVVLFVTFGLFNLIMAIFVENTIDNAKRTDAQRQEARHKEHIRVARHLQEIIVMFCTTGEARRRRSVSLSRSRPLPRRERLIRWFQSAMGTGTLKSPDGAAEAEVEASFSGAKNEFDLTLQVTREGFQSVLQSPEAQLMMDELDISMSSRESLFEILDSNGNGTLEVGELVEGLLLLRGSDGKGDAVASLLAIRSMQRSLKAMEVLGLHQQQAIQGIAASQEQLQAFCKSLGFMVNGQRPPPDDDQRRGSTNENRRGSVNASKKQQQLRSALDVVVNS